MKLKINRLKTILALISIVCLPQQPLLLGTASAKQIRGPLINKKTIQLISGYNGITLVIVFSHMNSKALDSEQWPSVNRQVMQYANAVQLTPMNNITPYYTLLPTKQAEINQLVADIIKITILR